MDMKIGTIRQVKELNEESGYTLSQIDFEIDDILSTVARKNKGYSFLFVKYDKSGADFSEIWALDSGVPYLEADAELIFFRKQ